MHADCRLSGSQTAENLARAFVLEAQAITKYPFFAKAAKNEGYDALGTIFLSVAEDERGHAEVFYDFLTQGLPKSDLTVPSPVQAALGHTPLNMRATIELERYAATVLYPEFARAAEQEGFRPVADSFRAIAAVEKRHDMQLSNMLERLEKGMLYRLPHGSVWICTNCGHHHVGNAAPEMCPACLHEQSFFMTAFDRDFPHEPVR